MDPMSQAGFGASLSQSSAKSSHQWSALIIGGCAGMAPDLRASPIPLDKDGFAAVVRDGSLVARGMPAHPHLADAQLEALQHYIRQRARDTL